MTAAGKGPPRHSKGEKLMNTKQIESADTREEHRPLDWLKEEIVLRLPRYWLAFAGLAALGLFLVAID